MPGRKTKPPQQPEPEERPLRFEEAIERLEQIVRELEEGDLSLEIALALFQEGVGLTRRLGAELDEAESRIEKLLEQNGQTLILPLED